ncbi:MAG: hypothetical protein WC428_02275 [Candidatus Paceibacterota bacterium]
MSNNNGDCKAVEKDTAFNELLRELAGEVDQASYNADAYRNKINKLDSLDLPCEQALKCGAESAPKKIEPDTILYKLRMIINQLNASNKKNNEILQHLSTIV